MNILEIKNLSERNNINNREKWFRKNNVIKNDNGIKK